jgi:V8-like Glu-specific endopeptidase
MTIKIKLSLSALLFFSAACDESTVATSSSNKKKSAKSCLSLIGGTKTQAYPASALIAYASGTTKFYTCSATFVGHNTMITAGHCLDKVNPASVRYLGNT